MALFHSRTPITNQPPRTKTAVPIRARREVTLRWPSRLSLLDQFQPRNTRILSLVTSSRRTGKPNPPMMMAPARGRRIHASAAYGTRLFFRRPKPALLNDEIAWKRPSPIARSTDIPYLLANRDANIRLTTPSTKAVKPRVAMRVDFTSPMDNVRPSAAAFIRSRRPNRPVRIIPARDVKLMIPRPLS